MNIHNVVVVVLWSIGCYLLGVATGTRIRHHRLTREVTLQIREAWQVIRRAGLGSMVMALALILAGTEIFWQHQHSEDVRQISATARTAAASALQVKRLGECVASYENQLSASLTPITAATKKNSAADIAWKRAVAELFVPGHDKRDYAAVKKLLDHNITVYDRLARERAQNPYPPPPRKVCPQ